MPSEPITEDFFPVINATAEELEREIARYGEDRRLSPEELGSLAQRIVDSTDPAEKEALREALLRGWYGGIIDA